jgi:isopentenyl-diphosphate Delta-isomerase
MVDKYELLCVVNEHDVPIKPLPRHVVFKKGLWRRTVHVWIINPKKRLLCQQRSLKKDSSPGMWEPAVVGHVGSGDNYFTGAVREVNEETGLNITTEDLKLVKIYKDFESREFRAIFYCELDVQEEHVKSEEDEVDKVKFINFKTVRKYLNQKHASWFTIMYTKEIFMAIA